MTGPITDHLHLRPFEGQDDAAFIAVLNKDEACQKPVRLLAAANNRMLHIRLHGNEVHAKSVTLKEPRRELAQ